MTKHNYDLIVGCLSKIDESKNYFPTATDFATEIGVSVWRFQSLFKEITNVSFATYIVQKRMNTAAAFLLTSNQPVKSIASSVGYSTKQSFFHAFKKHFGCTPREYSRQDIKVMSPADKCPCCGNIIHGQNITPADLSEQDHAEQSQDEIWKELKSLSLEVPFDQAKQKFIIQRKNV